MHPRAVMINVRYLTGVENSGWKSSPKITLHSFAASSRCNKKNPSLVFINKAALYEMYFRSTASSMATKSNSTTTKSNMSKLMYLLRVNVSDRFLIHTCADFQ